MNAVMQSPYKHRAQKNQSKTIDLTKLAHDLKGPLNSLKGLLQIASREVNLEEAQPYFKLIEQYQQLLYYRINDLLNSLNFSEKKSINDFIEQSRIFESIRTPLHYLISQDNVNVLGKTKNLSFTEKVNQVKKLNNTLDRLQKTWSDKKINKSGAINLVVLADHIKKSLNSIKILLEIAVKEIENKDAMDYFELIEKTRVQLFTRVEDSLKKLYGDDIISFTHIDFDEMISKIQLSLTNMDGFDDIKFKIRVKNSTAFYSDSDAIRSIIQNLLENSIKYRKHDNQIHAVGFSVEDNTDGIIMIIADNGIGIKKELVSKIFTFGVRDNNSSEEGHGIGLSLVKLLLDQLGGQISVNSVNNQGTLFTINIPNAAKSYHQI